MMNNGDLGFSWRKVGRGLKKAGKVGVSVATAPARVTMRLANVTTGVLCNKDGGAKGGDATSQSFCKAVRLKDYATVRRLMPAAAKVASARQKYTMIRTAYTQPQATQADEVSGLGCFACGFGGPPRPLRKNMRKMPVIPRPVTSAPIPRVPDDEPPASVYHMMKNRGWLDGADDATLLALAANASPDDLAFALAGVDPADIGAFLPKGDLLVAGALVAAIVLGLRG